MNTRLDSQKSPAAAPAPKKVAICIPSCDMVHADFAMSLAALAHRAGPFVMGGQKFPPLQIAIINTKGSLVVNNRNRLVKEAQALGVEYVMFLDSDIIVPPWALRRLLDHDKDIVGATYIQREEPHRLLGKALDGRMLDEMVRETPIDGETPMEVGALPGGCLLIKMSVFDVLERPYFQTPAHEATPVHPEWIEGEDYFICRKAREKGHSVWVDWGLSFSLGHVGQQINRIPTITQEKFHALV
jgi:hypothetical protein